MNSSYNNRQYEYTLRTHCQAIATHDTLRAGQLTRLRVLDFPKDIQVPTTTLYGVSGQAPSGRGRRLRYPRYDGEHGDDRDRFLALYPRDL